MSSSSDLTGLSCCIVQVSCKVINVRSGAELPEKCRELALHFESQGTPIMIGLLDKRCLTFYFLTCILQLCLIKILNLRFTNISYSAYVHLLAE